LETLEEMPFLHLYFLEAACTPSLFILSFSFKASFRASLNLSLNRESNSHSERDFFYLKKCLGEMAQCMHIWINE
jgi:hypothetical protein